MSQPNVNAVSVISSREKIKTLVTLAMLSAISYVVMCLSKLIPPVIGFLQLDLKDTVICIGGFVFGPLAAAVISLLVAIVEFFTVSHTGIIGCIMNMLATAAFCCTASYIYQKKHTRGGAVLGLALGTVVMTATMLLWNYLITPLYMPGFSREQIAAMLPTLFLPFNLLKGGLNMALALVIYKPVVGALRKLHMIPESRGAAVEVSRGRNVGFMLFTFALLATLVTVVLVLWGVI